MSLQEYVEKNYRNPNKSILKTLGASETLIQYLFKTPHNTNPNVYLQMCNSGTGVCIVDVGKVDESIAG